MATVRAIPSAFNIETRIRAMTEHFVRSYNQGNIDDVVAQFATDALVMPPNQAAARGHSAIHEVFALYYNDGSSHVTLDPTSIVQSGDVVLCIGTYCLNVVLPDGAHFTDRGKYLTNYQLVNNDCKIIYDMWNSDLPPVSVP